MMEVKNMPLSVPKDLIVGSTTSGAQPPQGQVIKLNVTKIADAQLEQERQTPPPLFGAHIKEGIAVVKDWMKKS
jgi:hypothetical protein